MKSVVIGLFMVFAAAGSLAAESNGVETAIAAFEAGRYDEAKALLEPAAASGAPVAQYYIARLFQEGLGVEADTAAAATWYRRSAEGYYKRMQSERARFESHKSACEQELHNARVQIQNLQQTLERIRRELERRPFR